MEANPTLKTRQLVRAALMAALVAVGAFIRIPVPYMDYFTLQFFFVLLAGLLLGPRLGAAAVGGYVLIGLLGFPVFAAGGGPAYILKPSFGYLIGFVAAAAVTGALAARRPAPSFKRLLGACGAGLAVTYAIGLLYKYLMLNLYLQTPAPLAVVLLSCLPLDLPGDAILCLLAAALALRLKKEGMFTC